MLIRDEFGIARGGIRLEDVDAPVAMNTGEHGLKPRRGADDDRPGLPPSRHLSREACLQRVREVTERDVREGFPLLPGAQRIIREAESGPVN